MSKIKYLPAALGLLLLSTSASAASDWTGWYFGANAAYSDGRSDSGISLSDQWTIETQALRDFVTSNWSTRLEPSGSGVGIQFGYDHQFSNAWVLGIEVDYSQLDLDRNRLTPQITFPSSSLSYAFGNSVEANDMWSIRPKLGYAFGQSLLYVSAGYGRVDVDASASIFSATNGYDKLGLFSDTLDATVYGLGYEYDFGNQWSLRAEYLRTDVDDFSFITAYEPGSTFVGPPPYTETVNQDLEFDTFRLGVNFRF